MAEGEIKVTDLRLDNVAGQDWRLSAHVDWKFELPPCPPFPRVLWVTMMLVMFGLGILVGRAL